MAAYSLECWHGACNNIEYFPYRELVRKALFPANLIYQKKIKPSQILEMKEEGMVIFVDSGAASAWLNAEDGQEGYSEGYPEDYQAILEEIQPTLAVALDYCFEKKHLQTQELLEENFLSQRNSIIATLSQKLKLMPVVQGWNRRSYLASAREVKELLREFDLERFGIGSVCRAKEERVKQVLSWVSEVLDLSCAHAFGQTQRTIPILRRFGVASLDTSNAVGNAGHRCYCDPFGNWWYGINSPRRRKHRLERFCTTPRELYGLLFRLNYQAIEYACRGIPADWVHPIHAVRVDDFIFEKMLMEAP